MKKWGNEECLGPELTNHPAEERAAALGRHCHHIHHALRVVEIHTTALHGRLFLAGKGFLAFIDFALHIAYKDTTFLSTYQKLWAILQYWILHSIFEVEKGWVFPRNRLSFLRNNPTLLPNNMPLSTNKGRLLRPKQSGGNRRGIY